MCNLHHKAPCNSGWTYLLVSYLCLESSSSQAAHIHICDDLISNDFLSVGRLMVSVSSWLLTLLAEPRRSHFLPSPRLQPFSLTMSRVWEGATTRLGLRPFILVIRNRAGSRKKLYFKLYTKTSSGIEHCCNGRYRCSFTCKV